MSRLSVRLRQFSQFAILKELSLQNPYAFKKIYSNNILPHCHKSEFKLVCLEDLPSRRSAMHKTIWRMHFPLFNYRVANTYLCTI